MAEPSGTTSARSQRRSERQQNIVETAATLFAEHGYADCDMDCVANALGIAKGTLYLYFPGKQELFFACVDWGMTLMQRSIRAAAEVATEPFDKIGRAIRAYLVFFEDHPQYVELLVQERAIFKDRKLATYFEHRNANRGSWREMYAELIASGRLRDDIPVERILDTLGNLVYGTMFTNHFVGRTQSLDDQYRTIMESVFRGFLSDKERRKWTVPPCEAVASESVISKPRHRTKSAK